MDSIVPAEVLSKHVSKISIKEEQEFWPSQPDLANFLA
jgi:hypothetical protein